ncbi:hypothetical protein RSO41_09355 [Halomonas sp. I1]|nr:hypothetical protein [Halomonas sp. I1]MDT8894863.1 hypothetical protein [Halomonas sp. I1]
MVGGVLIVPTLLTFVWIAAFGGSQELPQTIWVYGV